MDKIKNSSKGFTLLELLVVVLIIGILASIALPQYKKSVLKSKFTGLMVSAKAVRDGNEVYCLNRGIYAQSVNDLDVNIEDNTDTVITLSKHPDYNYTKATKTSLNGRNNLIMYQQHSKNFPSEIHCEAKQGDAQAEWLCREAFNSMAELGTIVTSGYNTFVIGGPVGGNGKLVLTSYDPTKKIAIIKAVKAKLGLSLKEAKELVESVPCEIGEGLSPEQRQALIDAITEAGGSVDGWGYRPGGSAPGNGKMTLASIADGKKMAVLKALRAQLGIGLKEAKDLVDSVPCVIGEGLSYEQKQALMNAITEAGGTLEGGTSAVEEIDEED